MNYMRTGVKTLSLYLIFSLFSWIAVEFLPNDIGVALVVIISILLIMLWHETIRNSMTKGLKDGILVSLFFIIPYVITVMVAYNALFNEKFSLVGILGYQLWTIFSNPMRLLPQGTYAEHNIYLILQPLLVITILVAVNVGTVKLSYKKIKE